MISSGATVVAASKVTDSERMPVKDVPAASSTTSISATRLPGNFISMGTGPLKRYIKADQLHIRVAADRYSKSLGLLYGGDEVFVSIKGDWAKLEVGKWIRSRWLVQKRPSRFKGGPTSSPGQGPASKDFEDVPVNPGDSNTINPVPIDSMTAQK